MATHIVLAALASALLATTTACTGAADTPDAASNTAPAAGLERSASASPSASANAEQPQILTDDLLQAWARGLKVEAEILRAPGRATHYGVMVSQGTEEGDLVLDAAGIPAAEYNEVARTVGSLFSILNARGDLGPKLIHFDLERSNEEMKQRLTGDPYQGLPPESADAIRRNLELLKPLWLDVAAMTAQHG